VDFLIWQRQTTIPLDIFLSPATVVPEPGTGLLLGLGTLAFHRSRRLHRPRRRYFR
jgi:hypothetical protein